jgi:hypothetical protein
MAMRSRPTARGRKLAVTKTIAKVEAVVLELAKTSSGTTLVYVQAGITLASRMGKKHAFQYDVRAPLHL